MNQFSEFADLGEQIAYYIRYLGEEFGFYSSYTVIKVKSFVKAKKMIN